MTHDLSFYITANLDHQIAQVKIVDDTILKTQGAGNIDLYILVENEYTQIKLSNVHYLLKLNANLISFKILEKN